MSFSTLSPLQINLLVCGLTFSSYVHDVGVWRSELLGKGGGKGSDKDYRSIIIHHNCSVDL